MDTKEAVTMLEQGVEDLFKSNRFREYLDVMSRFHDYSARNCMLIMMQKPTATRVASYKTWQKMNRQVRKGEKGIRILVPIPHKSIIRETDKTTGEQKEREHVWLSFKVGSVFDVSQTDGEDLPEIAREVDGKMDDFDRLCKAVENCTTASVEYGFDFGDPELHGTFNREKNHIKVAGGMSEAQTFKTLVHETAHSILHCKDGEQSNAPREIREVQAEGVAYVVCNVLGIDTSDYSFGYVAGWGDDIKTICKELDVIRNTANKILDAIAA